ncbi:cytochrome oxidase maturation protein (cbb3-t) [Oceanococcus atlanticus]|uniref:Cytochrome oxidase maturation protein (Cbb3-t) n=1 Tax=Oceanococcus atlanticus TaxID=1317117 RepID=A0A1Y1SDS0_9GAMM|nr:cbb3-type cytochrome oxidase assembly protein CcoS [Oceanococcus atlanticus]ORE87130.1 cytochrome oxidase maturation protein (cbb3-t) [Oceanococcus atlanticus]RZO86893.1 MAG: cbb3-type cytochrome oxidase assembly protein CcoS [Oceanococcus sp.]
MTSLYLLIPLSIGLVSLAAGVFIVAIRKGQFDDLDRQQQRMPDE